MRFRPTALLLALAALAALAVVPAGASAATSTTAKKRPVITRVTPMRVRVGASLTIRGRNFSSRRKRNTVIFRASNGRTAFAKPRRASRRKLVVRVPTAAARILEGKAQRFKIRVLVRRRFSRFTSRRLSPVLVPSNLAGIDGPASSSTCLAGDYDGDLLVGSLEDSVGTDPCLADTDGDGSSDGWEYYSAKDLNIKAVPYPGKRPFPNALDPSDANVDFDGDGLEGNEEYRAWRASGRSYVAAKAGGLDLQSPLGYSDGTKFSRASETPSVPAFRSTAYGLPYPSAPFPATYNYHGDPAWQDDERDADKDGLSNWLESRGGPSNGAWWGRFYSSETINMEPWPKLYCDYAPGGFTQRPFANLDLADADVDGDGLLDGEDDQDNDDYINLRELYEHVRDLDGDGQPGFCGASSVPTINVLGVNAPVNPFNPCVPSAASRTCPTYRPL